MMNDITKIKTDLEILWGAERISQAIGKSRRATYGMLEAGTIPAKRIGGRWCISRAELSAFFGVPHV